MDWQAVGVSFRLASLTTLILLLVGVPIAYWLAYSRFRFKFLIEALIALPMVLPPTVIGFYFLNILGPRSPLGHFYENLTGELFPFTFRGLLVGSIFYSLPFAIQPFLTSFSALDRRLIEASWSLGASKINAFFYLILPLSFPGIFSGMILSFAHTLGEFGIVMMIGGNIRGITRTVSISIFDDVQALNYASAGRTSLFLLGISFVVLAITTYLRKLK